jgi:hypothetical protein
MMNRGSSFPSRLAAGSTAASTAAAVLLTLALAACGGNSPARTEAAPTAASAASAASAAAAARPGSGTRPGTVKVPKYVAADNARKYISTTGCVQAGRSGWRLSGTATNTSAASRAYSIVVDFVTVTGDTVLDTKLLNVGPVAPKSAVDWSVTGAAGQHHVTCVIRQALAR